jgi:hypothetical protein
LKGRSVVPRLLDSKHLDVQVSHFKLTMSHNVEAMMRESKDVNLVTHMWLKIQSSTFLVHKLSEYMKVVEITMVMVLGSIEDVKTFNNLAFMKNKLCNWLTTHLDLCVRMFTQNVYTITNFPYDATIVAWKEVCMRYHANG